MEAAEAEGDGTTVVKFFRGHGWITGEAKPEGEGRFTIDFERAS